MASPPARNPNLDPNPAPSPSGSGPEIAGVGGPLVLSLLLRRRERGFICRGVGAKLCPVGAVVAAAHKRMAGVPSKGEYSLMP